MPTIFVVFPVFNRLQSTKEFLESLSKQTINNYRVVICDDGSTDGTGKYIRQNWPDIEVIDGTGKLWWTAGINRCISRVLEECAAGDYVLTINNDVTIPRDYLEQKLIRAEEFPGAIIGSVCVFMDDHDLIETSGYIMNFDKCSGRSLTKNGDRLSSQVRKYAEVTHLPGKGVLIPCEVFQNIGQYDERGLPQYHADTDFVLRAYKAGYKVLVDFESTVYSDVNLDNMTLPSEQLTLKNILKTFRGPYSQNNFKVYNHFAKKHFPNCSARYLVRQYIRIIGGLTLRYIKYRSSRIIGGSNLGSEGNKG